MYGSRILASGPVSDIGPVRIVFLSDARSVRFLQLPFEAGRAEIFAGEWAANVPSAGVAT
jgi:hypothetical protein